MASRSGSHTKSGNNVSPVKLSQEEIDEVTEVFDLFDFWDGRDGAVDAAKTGDMLYCLGLNPTLDTIKKNGGVTRFGDQSYRLEEVLAIYQNVKQSGDSGTFYDFIEVFKTYDREGQGYVSLAEMRNVLTSLGDRLTDEEMDAILKYTDLREDIEGNVKYEDFLSKVMGRPTPHKY